LLDRPACRIGNDVDEQPAPPTLRLLPAEPDDEGCL
jgi:hypothetical protein